MAAAPHTELAPGIHSLALGEGGYVAAVLVDLDGELTLFDTGDATCADQVVATIEALGHDLGALRRIVVTHAHRDHAGSAAELRERSGAEIMMTREDAELVASGFSSRPLYIAPGREGSAGSWVDADEIKIPRPIVPFEVDGHLEPGAEVPGVPGSEVIAAPGHCAGQVAILLTPAGGILIAADVAGNVGGLGPCTIAEDVDLSIATFDEIARRDFEVVVCGHGPLISSGGSDAFRNPAAKA